MRKSPKKPDTPNLRAIPATPARAGLQFTTAEFGAIFSKAYPELNDVQRKMLAELALLWVWRRREARSVAGGAA